MIDELITALSQEAGMSTEEIADTIWLALQIQESQSKSVASDFSLVKEDIGAIDNKTTPPKSQPQTPDSNETPKNQNSEAQKAKIYPQSQQQTESLDLSFKTPNAPSLRQPLTLARALKPLMRRIPGNKNPVVDEAATIESIANTRLWLPVLRPTLEPWLDLELVVDESISMQIWRQTIRDLEKLLKNYGIFRDVRVWGMTAKDGEKVEIRRGIGAAAKNKFPRSSKELIDGSSRRLVLVVSDCVSSYWRDGKVTKALEIWGNSVPTAIIQMLPKWLWKRTALGRASEVRLRALTPGVSNQNLIAREVSLWEELEEKKGVKVPIFTLEEDKATTWAQMLSGKSSVSTLGFVFKLDAPVKENKLFNLDYTQLSAEERVQAFRVTASPMARKLAGLLAAAPVISLPVVRLIRGALLRESLQVNVAEVFLGGLLKPLSEIKVEINPDDVLYGFMDGVRELLIDSMPSEWVLQVVDKVSEYVAERVGLSLKDFAAVLRREKKVEDSGVVEEVGYFATFTAQVLRRLGGEYEKIAEELERNYTTETDFIFLSGTNFSSRKVSEVDLSNTNRDLQKYSKPYPTVPKVAFLEMSTDEKLQKLITKVCDNSDFESTKRRRDMDRLLLQLQRLPGLIKYSHPLYMEALNSTLMWVSKNIHNFQPQPHLSIRTSLEKWINNYLRWRIKDLYLNQVAEPLTLTLSLNTTINDNLEEPLTLSLDTILSNNSEESLTLLEQLSNNSLNSSNVSGIDSYIEKQRNQKIQEIAEKLERYVEADPEQILQNCHPRKHPNCNCQVLCQKLLFQHPPDKLANISRELNITYDLLRAFWKRKCLPLLKEILQELEGSMDIIDIE